MSSFTGNARRSALQTSAFAPRNQASGPLHRGHTRISSSFGSMGFRGAPDRGEALQQEGFEFGWKHRRHAQEPEALVGERGAFYGILFRHDDHLRAGELQVAR